MIIIVIIMLLVCELKKKPNKHWLPSNVKAKVSPHPNSVIQHLTLPLFMLYGFHFYQANQDVSLEDFNEQKKKAKLRLDSLKVNRFFFYYTTNFQGCSIQGKEEILFISCRHHKVSLWYKREPQVRVGTKRKPFLG